MPRIPASSYVPQADVGAVTAFRADTSVLSPDLAAIPGRQQQGIGQGLQSLGGEVSRIAVDFQEQINQSRVLDARNNLHQYKGALSDDPKNGYLMRTGLDALKPEDGKSLADVYMDQYQKHQDTVMQGLDNDRQRQLLKPHADDVGMQIQQDTQRHALAQFKSYQLSNLDGQLKLSVDEAARSWQDPVKVQKNLLQAMTAVTTAGTVQGRAPAEIEAQVRITSSTVHARVLEAALEASNPTYANLYFQMHKDPIYVNKERQVVPKDTPGAVMMDGGMRADDILRFNSAMSKTIDNAIAQQSVGETVKKFTSRIVPTNMDRLTSIVLGIESNGADMGEDGKPLTSVKGAKYAMQVMPATAKDPGFGITAAKDDSPAEYNRVGREYLTKLVEKYGNVAHALAAYNAGPGAVDTALKEKGLGWLAALPKETQDYVAKGMGKFGSGQGAPQIPTEQVFVADAIDRLGKSPRPEQVQLTRAAAEHQYGIIVKSRKAQGDTAYENILRDAVAKGGDFNQIDPALKMELTRLAPEKYDDVIAFSAKLSKGQDIETNWDLFYQLKTDSKLLAATNLMSLRDKLGDAEFKSLTEEQQSVRTGKGDVTTRLRTTNDLVNQMMREVGIDPTPKDSDKDGAIKVGRIWAAIDDRVREAERLSGHPLKPEEVGKVAAKLFTTVNIGSSWWGNDVPAALVQPGQELVVPKTDRLQITEALRAARKPVTDESIQAIYRRAKGIK